jgi:deazaflavin-dependent oxidoreductase (nitroreductase family)
VRISDTSHSAGQGRPLLGLRRKPGRLALVLFRLPLKAYQHNAGPAVGRTFVAFTHVGRKTGQPHQAVAMVLRYHPATGEAVICAAWGPQTDWYRNLQARNAVKVQLGGQTFTPQQRFLPEDEAFDVALDFRREHPHRMRLLSSILGWGDLRDNAAVREFVRIHPFVAFRPAAQGTTSPGEATPARNAVTPQPRGSSPEDRR